MLYKFSVTPKVQHHSIWILCKMKHRLYEHESALLDDEIERKYIRIFCLQTIKSEMDLSAWRILLRYMLFLKG
jgi:hypothetical protein